MSPATTFKHSIASLSSPASPAVGTDGFLQRIVHAIVEPVFVKDAARRFVLMNDACCALLGVEREDLLGHRGHRQVGADRLQDEELLRTGVDQTSLQSFRDPLGRPRRVAVRKLLYRDERGTPFIVGLLQDAPAGDPAVPPACEKPGLRRELQQALRREELAVYFQPIVSLATGRIQGAEALVRWPHPRHGLVLPDEFIPLAEETGLILPLGEWVMRQSCHRAARWLREGLIDAGFTLNVNLSPRQLGDSALVPYTGQILAASGLPARMLQLELSELTVARETTRACALRDLGVRLAIDDFGTGYASFASLRERPVDTVKVAGTFTANLGESAVDHHLVRTILGLVRDLGLLCVVEGIETSRQWALLRDLHCELGQGFYFHRPLPACEIEALLASGRAKPAPVPPILSFQRTA